MSRSARWGGLALLLLLGAWLRFAELGRPSFDTDEYWHVFAAQAVNATGEPRLPSGNLYTRVRWHTDQVATAFRLFGVSEASARIPSVLWGLAAVLLTYAAGRRWLGPGAGLAAAAVVAASPVMVETARFCRMYAMFQALYLGAAIAYAAGWETTGVRLRTRAVWTAAGLALLAAALKTQSLAMSFIPAVAVYWLGRALVQPRSRYTVFLGAAAAGAALIALTGIVDVPALWAKANRVPDWAAARQDDSAFYLKEWQEWYPWLVWVAPAGAAAALARSRALGWYLVCQFAVPFALHSLVFDWKVRRYVSHLFPLLALLLAPLLEVAARWAWRWLKEVAAPASPGAPLASRAGWGAAGCLLAAALIAAAWPSMAQTLSLRNDPRRPRWRQGYAFLKTQVRPGDAVLAAVPLSAHHYLGAPATHAFSGGEWDHEARAPRDADGFPLDWYAGLPMVHTLEALRRVQAKYPRVWIVSNRGRFTDDAHTEPSLRAYIREHYTAYHPIEGSTTVQVFGWGIVEQVSAAAPEPAS
jgi:hypothetical protein